MTDNEKCPVSFEMAEAMLPDGSHVHTFRSSVGMLVGADWERCELLDRMRRYESTLEIGGPECQRFGHGLAMWDDYGPLFIQCKECTDYGEIERRVLAGSVPDSEGDE
jgi:hypothetical protein